MTILLKMTFKDEEVFRAAFKVAWHPILVNVHLWIRDIFGKVIITETSRIATWPGDVHATDPLRAFDIRSWVYLLSRNKFMCIC